MTVLDPPRKKLTLRRNFGWTLIGTTVFSAMNWAMQIVLTKCGSPAIFGKYALGIAITQPLFAFAQMQLRSIQATDAKNEYEFHDYFILRLLCSLAALVALVFFAFPGNPLDTAIVVMLTGVGVVLDSISDVIYGLEQKHHRMDYNGKSWAIKGVLNITLLGTGFYLTHNIIIALLGSVASSALVVLFYDRPAAMRIMRSVSAAGETIRSDWFIPPRDRGIDWAVVKQLLIVALPLGVTMSLMGLSTNITRYVLDHFLGESRLGIYSALSSLIVVARTIIVAFGVAINPRLAEAYKSGDISQFKKDMARFALFCTVVGGLMPLVAVVGGPRLIAAIFTRDYSHDFAALIVLLLSGGASYLVSCLGYGITAAGLYRVQVVWFGVSTAVAAATAWLLVPPFGLLGGAYAALITQVIQAAIGAYILVRGIRTGAAGRQAAAAIAEKGVPETAGKT